MKVLEMVNAGVRPAVTLAMAGTFCYLTITGTIEAQTFVGTATAVIIWWFKARDDFHKAEEDEKNKAPHP